MRRSLTDRAIGPSLKNNPGMPISTGSIDDTNGTRPMDGFNEAIPQQYAGFRTEPPISLPRPNGLIPVAIAAASPPLDPPGVRVRSQGLNVRPRSGLSVSKRMPNSGKFVRPIGIAPAATIRSTIGEFCFGMTFFLDGTPSVVGVPIKSIFSLTVKGTP